MALFSRADSYLGLDIGTSSIKLVELRRKDKDHVALQTYAMAGGMAENPLVAAKDADAVAHMVTVIREMIRRSGAGAKDVVAALPSLSVFSSILALPEMRGRELEQAVVHAAQSYVPSPLKDVVLGWSVIAERRPEPGSESLPERQDAGPSAAPAPPPAALSAKLYGAATSSVRVGMTEPAASRQKMQDVFLTAAPKDLVQRYSSVVERLDMRLLALEIESFPLSRSLLAHDQQPVFLVDIGDRATNFTIVDREYLRLNQGIDIGGASVTSIIIQQLGVSFQEAEKKKRAENFLSGGPAQNSALGAAVRNIMRDIVERSQNLRRLYEQKSRRPIQRVILIGGGANLRGLPAFWQEITGLPAEVGNPWKGILVPDNLTDRLRVLGPSFAVAVGLALREFEGSK